MKCPLCGSEKIINHGNGQGDYCAPETDDDLLYVALGNDWFDGVAAMLKCENDHTFYLSHEPYAKELKELERIQPWVDYD